MRIFFNLIPAACFWLLLCGCSTRDENPTPDVGPITVSNDGRSALTAGIRFTLAGNSNARIKYWPAEDGELKAVLSAVSPSGKHHNMTLFALSASTTYQFRLVVGGEESDIRTFTTAALPAEVTSFYDEARNRINNDQEGAILLHNSTKPGCAYVVGQDGRLLWYRLMPNKVKALRVTPKNTLLALLDNLDSPFADGNILLETTWAGDTLFHLKLGEKGFDKMGHHDVQMNRNGDIVLITNEVRNGLPGDGILVINSRGEKIWAWNTFDELGDFDPAGYAQPWANSLVIDSDGHYIVSFRALNQVWKIHSVTGSVLWKLGKQGDVDLPADDVFLLQHFAHRAKNGEILLFDNGSSQRPLSRVVSYRVDESNRKAISGIKITLPNHLYSAIMGSACLLPDESLLVTSATNQKIMRIARSGAVIWTLTTNAPVYRAEHISEPFAH